MDGVLLLDKNKGLVSHTAVRKLRKIFSGDKVGHLGTLDPMATGLLPILVGKANRLHRFMNGARKRYHAEVFLGQSTNTYDSEGTATSELVECDFTEDEINSALEEFRGTFEQKPPAFSAIKMKGVPLYKYARRGKEVELPTREVEIYSNEIIELKENRVLLDIHCGSGTYIRSIAHDLGRALGCGGYLAALRRTVVGEFTVNRAMELETVIETSEINYDALPFVEMENLVRNMPAVSVDVESATTFCYGSSPEFSENMPTTPPVPEFELIYDKPDDDLYRVFHDEKLIGVCRIEDNSIKPVVVLCAPDNQN